MRKQIEPLRMRRTILIVKTRNCGRVLCYVCDVWTPNAVYSSTFYKYLNYKSIFLKLELYLESKWLRQYSPDPARQAGFLCRALTKSQWSNVLVTQLCRVSANRGVFVPGSHPRHLGHSGIQVPDLYDSSASGSSISVDSDPNTLASNLNLGCGLWEKEGSTDCSSIQSRGHPRQS